MPHPYATEAYAEALSFLGQPTHVHAWGAFVLARKIAGNDKDALGVYPRTPIVSGGDLAAGLNQLSEDGLVSAVVVPEPLGAPSQDRLRAAFDVCQPFKTHLLMERRRGFSPSKHHVDLIRRGGRRCLVSEVALSSNLQSWRQLYDVLVERHSIEGVTNFPDEYFERLARLDAVTTFQARVDGAVAGMSIWVYYDGIATSHLSVTNALGYRNSASYALYAAAFDHFTSADFFDLGGSAGHRDDPLDGLFQFKQGFANSEIRSTLCGAILDRARYRQLAGDRVTEFFPAYRA